MKPSKNFGILTLSLGALFTITLLSSFTTSQTNLWERLGSRKVSYVGDHDEMMVTAREGTFRALKIKVEKADVHIDHIVVHYRHGRPESLPVRSFIKAGGETRKLDLKGRNRIIRKVDFYYKTPVKEMKKAKVILLGQH